MEASKLQMFEPLRAQIRAATVASIAQVTCQYAVKPNSSSRRRLLNITKKHCGLFF